MRRRQMREGLACPVEVVLAHQTDGAVLARDLLSGQRTSASLARARANDTLQKCKNAEMQECGPSRFRVLLHSCILAFRASVPRAWIRRGAHANDSLALFDRDPCAE